MLINVMLIKKTRCIMTTFSPHNNKKSYLLDLFAALSIKCGAKIIPNHENTTFLGSRFEHFQTLINGGVLIRSGEMVNFLEN